MFALDTCPLTASEREATPVVIGIFNREVDVPSVARAIRAAGFAKRASTGRRGRRA